MKVRRKFPRSRAQLNQKMRKLDRRYKAAEESGDDQALERIRREGFRTISIGAAIIRNNG